MEVQRGEEIKKRALNLIKKLKLRIEAEKRETKKKYDKDPDIDVSIEEIRESIRKEKEAARVQAQEEKNPENPGLEESTDSDFTVTFEGVPGSPGQDKEEEEDSQDRDTSEDSGA